MFLIILDSRKKNIGLPVEEKHNHHMKGNKAHTVYSVKDSIGEIHVKLLTLYIKERNSSLREDFV